MPRWTVQCFSRNPNPNPPANRPLPRQESPTRAIWANGGGDRAASWAPRPRRRPGFRQRAARIAVDVRQHARHAAQPGRERRQSAMARRSRDRPPPPPTPRMLLTVMCVLKPAMGNESWELGIGGGKRAATICMPDASLVKATSGRKMNLDPLRRPKFLPFAAARPAAILRPMMQPYDWLMLAVLAAAVVSGAWRARGLAGGIVGLGAGIAPRWRSATARRSHPFSGRTSTRHEPWTAGRRCWSCIGDGGRHLDPVSAGLESHRTVKLKGVRSAARRDLRWPRACSTA